MSREDRRLLMLLEESKNGSKESYKKFIAEVNDDIVKLISFIYDNEETVDKLDKYIVSKMYAALAEFNPREEDVRLWVARFTTMSVYDVYCKQNDASFRELTGKNYDWESIEQDERFAVCASEYNRCFVDDDVFRVVADKFKNLTKLERLLYQMYCYENYTVDELESLLQTDSVYIADAIAQLREKVIGEANTSEKTYASEKAYASMNANTLGNAGMPAAANTAGEEFSSGETAKELYNNGTSGVQPGRADAVRKNTGETVSLFGGRVKVSKKDYDEKFIYAMIPDRILASIVAVTAVLIVVLSVVVVLNVGKTGKKTTEPATYETVPGATVVNPDSTNNMPDTNKEQEMTSQDKTQPESATEGGSTEQTQPESATEGGSTEQTQPESATESGSTEQTQPEGATEGGSTEQTQPESATEGGSTEQTQPEGATEGGSTEQTQPESATEGGSTEQTQPESATEGGSTEQTQPESATVAPGSAQSDSKDNESSSANPKA